MLRWSFFPVKCPSGSYPGQKPSGDIPVRKSCERGSSVASSASPVIVIFYRITVLTLFPGRKWSKLFHRWNFKVYRVSWSGSYKVSEIWRWARNKHAKKIVQSWAEISNFPEPKSKNVRNNRTKYEKKYTLPHRPGRERNVCRSAPWRHHGTWLSHRGAARGTEHWGRWSASLNQRDA